MPVGNLLSDESPSDPGGFLQARFRQWVATEMVTHGAVGSGESAPTLLQAGIESLHRESIGSSRVERSGCLRTRLPAFAPAINAPVKHSPQSVHAMSRRPKNNKKNRTTTQPETPVPPVAQNARLAEAVQLFEDYSNPLATIDQAQEAIKIAAGTPTAVPTVAPTASLPVAAAPITVRPEPAATAKTIQKPVEDDSEWDDFGDFIFDEEHQSVAAAETKAASDQASTIESAGRQAELTEASDSCSFEDGIHDEDTDETAEPCGGELDQSDETITSQTTRRVVTIQPQFDTQQLAEVVGQQVANLADALRTELRTSISELQASQAAAASAQSEVLKTLSEIIFQTAAAREPSGDAIERAVGGMEDRLFARLSSAGISASVAESSPTGDNSAVADKGKEKHAGFAARLPKPLQNAVRSWDEIRTELMSHSDLSDATVSIHASSAPSPTADGEMPMSSAAFVEATQLTSDRHFRLPEQDPLLEVPNAVDPESLDETQLREAFKEREAFISTLISRIRRQHENMTGLLSADQLRMLQTEMPEDLANLIRVTLRRMDDLARMGELEMALERARIARQLNQLQHSRQIIEHNARQLGMTLNPDGSISSSGGPQKTSNSRRWLGKLGFGQ